VFFLSRPTPDAKSESVEEQVSIRTRLEPLVPLRRRRGRRWHPPGPMLAPGASVARLLQEAASYRSK
jgi:hypothetical protein